MTEEKHCLFTIFGATGDLAKRKLYPSLFRLYKKKEKQKHFAVIGTARRPWTDDFYRQVVIESISELVENNEEQAIYFASHFYYQSHDAKDTEHYITLKKLGEKLKKTYQTNGNQIFYLAMAPHFFGSIVSHLKSQRILTKKGFERLIIEKPFGSNLKTATILNKEITKSFPEKDIFRIDHYLGKEMIQNISAVRFGNLVFEALWNKEYINNVQITFAESIGVEERAEYYETSGALRDMVQNHILQVLSLLAMEAPKRFEEKEIRQEKIKALQAIRQYSEEEALKNFIPGQYAAGDFDGEHFLGYCEEQGVAENSTTETFVAGKFFIDNERWQGVPFYVRTGKRLTEKGTRINIIFKKVLENLFDEQSNSMASPNVLTIYIQPTEGFSLLLNGKEVGKGFKLAPLKLQYRHDATILSNSAEAYEKLILDVLNGKRANFSHWDEVARSWELIDVIRNAWDNNLKEIPKYKVHTMGPYEALELLKENGCHWEWKPDEWYIQRGKL
ncbi:MAG: glucose-6-phosphate dehydrogenase [Streptococcaceae bacterium]|jgi:glucose-6-phosphate 1-dehydrogenase|nr:glucose-6-phosphate dehydrogenase [Streptococcaceae bacterium]